MRTQGLPDIKLCCPSLLTMAGNTNVLPVVLIVLQMWQSTMDVFMLKSTLHLVYNQGIIKIEIIIITSMFIYFTYQPLSLLSNLIQKYGNACICV